MNASIPPDLKDRVLLAVANTPSVTRSEARRRAAGYSVLAAIPMVILLFLAGGPGHAEGRPFGVTLALTAGCLIMAMGATWMAASRTRWMMGPGQLTCVFIALGLPLVYVTWIGAFHGLYTPPFERFGIRCFFLALAAAPWPYAAMAMWRKLIEPRHPALLGGVFGAVAGAWSGLVVVLFCPLSEPAHLARGHWLPFVVLVAAGSRIGSRLFGIENI